MLVHQKYTGVGGKGVFSHYHVKCSSLPASDLPGYDGGALTLQQ
jgi:hypothetical protein